MNVNFSVIKNYIQESCPLISEKVGQLASRVVRECRQGFEYLKKDPHLCKATVAILNIGFLHTAFGVATLVNKLWTRKCGEEEVMEKTLLQVRHLSILTVFVGLMVGMNMALWKGLEGSIGKGTFTATSIASCISYILFLIFLKK